MLIFWYPALYWIYKTSMHFSSGYFNQNLCYLFVKLIQFFYIVLTYYFFVALTGPLEGIIRLYFDNTGICLSLLKSSKALRYLSSISLVFLTNCCFISSFFILNWSRILYIFGFNTSLSCFLLIRVWPLNRILELLIF